MGKFILEEKEENDQEYEWIYDNLKDQVWWAWEGDDQEERDICLKEIILLMREEDY